MDRKRRPDLGLGWVGGCAIGCGVATILLIIILVAGVFFAKTGIEKGSEQVISELKKGIAEQTQQEKMSPEAATVFNESVSLLETTKPTPFASFVIAQLFEQYKKGDEAERAKVLEAVKELNEFLRTHPGAGMKELFEFGKGNQKLQELLKDKDGQGYTVKYQRNS